MTMTIRLELTPAQARKINEALAYLEGTDYAGELCPAPTELAMHYQVLARCREKVHSALDRAAVQP
jgi:hypothetical protein